MNLTADGRKAKSRASSRRVWMMGVLSLAAVALPANVSRATPTDAVAVAAFHCQSSMWTFPWGLFTNLPNCGGGANGAMQALSGKSGSYVFGPTTSSIIDKGYRNFRIYNMVTAPTCQTPPDSVPPPPVVGIGGDLTMEGFSVLQGFPAYVHAHVTMLIVASNAFVATLIDVHTHNGTALKTHIGGTGSGIGVAAGKFTLVPPIGTCDQPNTQQKVAFDGVVATTA